MEEEDINKNIDETWKQTVDKEREEFKDKDQTIPPEASFSLFISTLALQASIFLGQTPNPVTNKKEKNLPQAKFIIDTLDMLKEKTKNNLSKDEGNLLEDVLYGLRMQYVAADKGSK